MSRRSNFTQKAYFCAGGVTICTLLSLFAHFYAERAHKAAGTRFTLEEGVCFYFALVCAYATLLAFFERTSFRINASMKEAMKQRLFTLQATKTQTQTKLMNAMTADAH